MADESIEIHTWNAVLQTLKDTFGLPGFRQGQEDIVRSVMMHHDTLAVMPTGSGKSLCYQLPGVITPGLTLVITPLIALMKDQVDALVRKGVRAAGLNSTMSYAEQQSVYDDVGRGQLKMLFVAPERMRNAQFQAILSHTKIGLVAVDEAHCISQWGHDFRPDYRRIGALRAAMNYPTTIALTATAAPDVQRDIVQQLQLKSPDLHILGFDRLNLRFAVKTFKTPREKLEFVRTFVQSWIQQRCGFERKFPGMGILYASTIKQAEEVGAYLRDHGIRVGIYHAQLTAVMRTRVQEQFMRNEFHCLIATTAFGMGVDKPDIRYVLHLSLSASVEAYTQESGRAGRDRLPAECLLLYTYADVKIQQNFIESASPDLDIYHRILDAFAQASHSDLPQPGSRVAEEDLCRDLRKKDMSKLSVALRKLRARELLEYGPDESWTWRAPCPKSLARELASESRDQKKMTSMRLQNLTKYVFEENCRTKFILDYFGSRESRQIHRCHHCDLCGAMPIRPVQGTPGPFPPEPLHIVLLKLLSTLARGHQKKYPMTAHDLAVTLTGHTTDRPEDAQWRTLSTFGLLGYMDEAEIPILAAVLRDSALITQTPHEAHLALTPAGLAALAARSMRDFPPVIQNFMRLRFPNAVTTGEPWMPGQTDSPSPS